MHFPPPKQRKAPVTPQPNPKREKKETPIQGVPPELMSSFQIDLPPLQPLATTTPVQQPMNSMIGEFLLPNASPVVNEPKSRKRSQSVNAEKSVLKKRKTTKKTAKGPEPLTS